jgi:hypothetical protein
MRLVQAGTGAARDVVLVYHLAPEGDGAVRAAIGPGACILNETVPQASIGAYGTIGPGGLSTVVGAIGWAQGQADTFQPRRLMLAGFSAGYIAVRTQLLAGIDPDAVVVADGIQSPRPGSPADVKVWSHYADEATKGERVFVASHSTQGATGLLSTTETLRLVTGFPLDHAGPLDAPVVSRDGKLVVWSFSGNDHHAQGYAVLPRMLALAMDLLAAPAADAGGGMGPGAVVGIVAGALTAGWVGVRVATKKPVWPF